MSIRATAAFEVTGWDGAPYDERDDEPVLSRATITKTFTGEVYGTSTTQFLACQAADGSAGYIAQERFEGRIGELAGTFVMQHGGIRSADTAEAFGHVVPGSGTGSLSGLKGQVRYQHDEAGAVFTIDYDLG